MKTADPIILFDGVCNLCNKSVLFVIKRDTRNYFKFASLQSDTGKRMLEQYQLKGKDKSFVVLIEDNKAYSRSSAALRIARRLKGPWKFLYAFILVPGFIRNGVYDLIARNRYKWFGKQDDCMIPTPELKNRFLD